ncbi:MAG: DUF3048 domain-containing protein [Clostridiales bacterium]|nr:DUF3048 domain-containing protein [Clostridiales bacterium]
MMKKFILLLLISVVFFGALPALAVQTEPIYTIVPQGNVLQNVSDRGIQPVGELSANPMILAQSPTTGLPAAAGERYLPMLVQISTPQDKEFRLAGAGDKASWGTAHADLLYESLLNARGETRFVALFSDSFAQNQPQSVGAVRSARQPIVLLQQEWQGGVVFGGCVRTDNPKSVRRMLISNGVYGAGLAFDLYDHNTDEFKSRVHGLGAPNNMDIHLVGIRSLVPEGTVSTAAPFLFTDSSPYREGYDAAATVSLDWGHQSYISHFKYDESLGQYLRFTGDQPSMMFASSKGLSAESKIQMSFSNVIIQRMEYEPMNASGFLVAIPGMGMGNADFFIGGHYIAGYWVRESESSPTIFLDDQGNQIYLNRGKTYVAHFPNDALLTYQGQ